MNQIWPQCDKLSWQDSATAIRLGFGRSPLKAKIIRLLQLHGLPWRDESEISVHPLNLFENVPSRGRSKTSPAICAGSWDEKYG